jgi:hypothetical protein
VIRRGFARYADLTFVDEGDDDEFQLQKTPHRNGTKALNKMV